MAGLRRRLRKLNLRKHIADLYNKLRTIGRGQTLSVRHPYFCVVILLVYGLLFETGIFVIHPLSSSPDRSISKQSAVKQPTNKNTKANYPFRATNLEILQKATPVDITFQNVAKTYSTYNNEQNPPSNRGGLDEAGNLGYVPDVTALRTNPPSFNLTGEALKDACSIRDSNYKMIHEKVSITDPGIQKDESTSVHQHAKILCVVQTSGHRHHDKIPALRRTWGPKCDGFVVASNITDPSLGTVNIPHSADADQEIYMRKWMRVRSTWGFIYDNYYKDFDWFYFSNDMVFLLVENLRLYLESDELQAAAHFQNKSNEGEHNPKDNHQIPLFLGRRFALGGNLSDVFNSAGPGFVVNKAALKTFVVEGGDDFPLKAAAKEELMIAQTFRSLGVYPYDTQDDTDGERFMITTPGHHYESKFPEWYHKQSIGIQHGVDHCSAASISFNYVSVPLMYRLYALLYAKCS